MDKKARIEKVVSQLPSTLQKNTIYYVRVGNGFDIYVTNDSGFIVAYPSNYVTLYTEQNIEGAKWFRTAGGNQYLNHRLRIISDDGSNPGMVFYKSGTNVGTIQYDGNQYLFTTSNTNAFTTLVGSGFIKEGSNDGYVLLGGGGHKPVSDFALSSQLGNYVTINTPQTITSGKTFAGGSDNSYTGASVEIRGNGTTVFPTLSFHQPGVIASVISLRIGGFNFMNPDGVGYENVIARGFYKNGSSDARILLGGGGDIPISDFASNKYIDYSDTRIITPSSIESRKFQYGFTSWTNDSYFPYADYIHFGSYPDSSGGEQNLIMFKKSGWGIRQYQSSPQNSNPYTDFVDYWHTGNFNQGYVDEWINKANEGIVSTPMLQNQLSNYLTQRGGWHTGALAKTDFPLSVTDHTGDPSTTGFQSYYGTSFHFKGPNSWYNRLDFPVHAEKLFLYQGINTTDMTFRGYLPVLNGNVTNWDSTNFNPSSYVTQSSLISQLGNYATLNGVQTFSNTITFNQSPVIPNGTLGSHAVTVLQLNTKISALDSATGVGFYLGDAESPYLQHVIHGSISLVTKNYAQNLINNRVLSENNAVALGFVGATANTPYVKHANGTEIRLSTETWSSNNFITLFSDQDITGVKNHLVSPKVPFAIESDDAVPLGQTEEIVQIRINDTFAEVVYQNSANDLIFDFNSYRGVKMVTITCKGNNFENIRVENMPKSVTLKIMNASPYLNPMINFDGGSIITSIGNSTWAEFYRDQDGDIFKNNVNGTNII
ncbi:hypothetical protein [Chryseobacterium sp. 8AT]|uniref:hypothetical protein n=1 Tax=Chryseobacterium sp. 8AT TaxID=2653134 RepID=UPI001356CEE2|nr:hypothetical protein [Chryseobacterium sp. 8AT]